MRTHQRRKQWDPKRWYVPRKPWWRCCCLAIGIAGLAAAVLGKLLTA